VPVYLAVCRYYPGEALPVKVGLFFSVNKSIT